jgi:hypothetical protein
VRNIWDAALKEEITLGELILFTSVGMHNHNFFKSGSCLAKRKCKNGTCDCFSVHSRLLEGRSAGEKAKDPKACYGLLQLMVGGNVTTVFELNGETVRSLDDASVDTIRAELHIFRFLVWFIFTEVYPERIRDRGHTWSSLMEEDTLAITELMKPVFETKVIGWRSSRGLPVLLSMREAMECIKDLSEAEYNRGRDLVKRRLNISRCLVRNIIDFLVGRRSGSSSSVDLLSSGFRYTSNMKGLSRKFRKATIRDNLQGLFQRCFDGKRRRFFEGIRKGFWAFFAKEVRHRRRECVRR